MQRKICRCPRATKYSLFRILSRHPRDPEFSRPCDWVSSGQGLSISSEWEVPVVFWEGAVEGSHPKAHKSVCPIFLSDFGEPRLRRAHWSCLELGWLGHQKFEDGEGGSSPKVGTCQAHRNWGELSLPQIHTTQSLTPIKSARTFISQTQAADFFTGLEFHKVRQQGVWSIGPAHSPRLMLHGGECSTQAWCCLWCERGAQHRDPGSSPSALYPELQPLVSLQTTLVLFVLPPLLTRWVAVNDILWTGPLRGHWCLADSSFSLLDRILPNFHSQMLCSASSQLWCCGLGNLSWGWDPTLLRRNLYS